MNKLRLILVLLVATVNVQSTPSARADLTPTVFVRNVFDPVGVAVDPSGNIWASIQGTANAYLIKYSPAGQLLDRIALGNFFTSTGLSCHIAIDASTGLLWAIGDVFVVDTTTDKGMAIDNLRQLTLDASKTVDVSTGTVHDFSGYLFTVTTAYGDVSIGHQGATSDCHSATTHTQPHRDTNRLARQVGPGSCQACCRTYHREAAGSAAE